MDYIILGQRIRRHRLQKKLTQEQLAEQVGVSPAFLGHVERGSRIPSLETLMKLCRALAVTPNALLGDPGQEDALPEYITISTRKLMEELSAAVLRCEKP